MKVLVTGAAGFIGYHACRRLVQRGDDVAGLDNLNEYYDVRIKLGRLDELGIGVDQRAGGMLFSSSKWPNFRFEKCDIEDSSAMRELFHRGKFDCVCNLAAQAGVRYSLTNPDVYVTTNIKGFLNVLEACRANAIAHLVYASSSSVYGIDKLMPFGETGSADHPASLYAASKRANELMAHSYSHLYGIPTTGLRFFTVYGPWGRPDMALFIFTKAMLEGRPIDVYNNGNMQRDFTYIDDIVEGVVRVLDKPPRGEPGWDGRQSSLSPAPYRVYNIGNGAPVRLMDFIEALERELGLPAKKNLLPAQPGDVAATWADCAAIETDFGFRPQTSVKDGIQAFVRWYRAYFGSAR